MPFMQAKHRQVHLRTRVFFSKEACSMSEPTAIFSIYDDKDKEIREVLTSVYRALKEKGYNPINQIVGYLLSEDPTYITNYNGARTEITKIDRDELMEELVRNYLFK